MCSKNEVQRWSKIHNKWSPIHTCWLQTRPGGVPHRFFGVIFVIFEPLGGLGRFGRMLRPVYHGSWEENVAKMILRYPSQSGPKSIEFLSKNWTKHWCILQSFFWWILMDSGRENGGKLSSASTENRYDLREADFWKIGVFHDKTYYVQGSGGPSWEPKLIKNHWKIEIQDRMLLVIDSSWILMGFEKQVGKESRPKAQDRSKTDSKGHRKISGWRTENVASWVGGATGRALEERGSWDPLNLTFKETSPPGHRKRTNPQTL